MLYSALIAARGDSFIALCAGAHPAKVPMNVEKSNPKIASHGGMIEIFAAVSDCAVAATKEFMIHEIV